MEYYEIDVSPLQEITASMKDHGALAVRLIDQYLADIEGRVAALREAGSNAHLEAVEALAHDLCSTSRLVGTRAVAELAADLETSAKAGLLSPRFAELEEMEQALPAITEGLRKIRADLDAN